MKLDIPDLTVPKNVTSSTELPNRNTTVEKRTTIEKIKTTSSTEATTSLDLTVTKENTTTDNLKNQTTD